MMTRNEMIEHLARREAAHHYAARFNKKWNDPHVQDNVDGNWPTFAPPIDRALRELTVLGVSLPIQQQ